MTLSTHVLDAGRGEPAAGVPVQLERSQAGSWAAVASGTTGGDGRLAGWATPQAGIYRLVFTVDTPFYPEIVVVFRVTEPDRHHHVPLLLSSYGYTTYRGS